MVYLYEISNILDANSEMKHCLELSILGGFQLNRLLLICLYDRFF